MNWGEPGESKVVEVRTGQKGGGGNGGTKESDGRGDHEKKKMRKGSYVNTTTWIEANEESVQTGTQTFNSGSKPRRTHEENVEGKGDPPAWDGESIPLLFQTGFIQQGVSEFYLPSCLLCRDREMGKY